MLSVAKTKVLIGCAVTTQLISAFVFTYAKIRFSHDTFHLNFQAEFLRRMFEGMS